MPSSASTEAAATYEVVHTTKYKYREAVSVSHHLARVKPREFPGQQCLVHELLIDPVPAVVRSHRDYFGNTVTFFIVERAHSELTVRATSTVKVIRRQRPAPASTPSWEEARHYDGLPLDALECLFDSASIAVSR